jgi:hypothetical protein
MSRVYYFANSCPLSHECSTASWKKAHCWGWTIEEAQDQLMSHLSKSGLHSHRSRAAKEDIVANYSFLCDVSDEVLQSDSEECEESQPERKKPKHHHVVSKPPIGARLKVATGSSASASGLAPTTPPADAILESRMAVRDKDIITISRQQLDSAMDSINLAYQACRHAQKLSAAAAEAFSQESRGLVGGQVGGRCDQEIRLMLI